METVTYSCSALLYIYCVAMSSVVCHHLSIAPICDPYPHYIPA